MSVLPQSGELTFLFTDVEGSTRLWERHPDEMPRALRRHLDSLETAIDAHGGAIVKETGDGLFAAFAEASSAVSAAVASQRALAGADWPATGPLRARIGLHTGQAILERDDYHGTEVNRCARLMGTAHGGQTIVSEATHALVLDRPPADITFVDLGEHRLKDLARAERIYEVRHPGLDGEFPPLRSLGSFPNNLPVDLSSFIGRHAELAVLSELLEANRLVTLTGAGGAGKTRVALQAAADRIEHHPHGVWLADLAGLSDPGLVAQAMLSALRAPELPDRAAHEALLEHVAELDVLIVVDNCEHLLGPVAEIVARALARGPNVRFVATSREPLGVPGEVVWRVPSMSLLDEDGTQDGADSEAMMLFAQRAMAAEPDFEMTAEMRPVVATICRRLDGLPLAIELAAARVRALTVHEIADRLHDRFALLTGGARTALPRQRTLEAAVGWSYDLLDEDERRLFERLSIFAGPFDLRAAEDVGSAEPIERSRVLDLLAGLVDRSLVSTLRVSGASRYRLLETLRDYGRKRLVSRGEAGTMRDAHLDWAVAFAQSAGERFMGPEQVRVRDDVAASLDDMRAALDHSLSSGRPELGLRIALGLRDWWTAAAIREGRAWLERLLASAEDLPDGMKGGALTLLAVLLAMHGEREEATDAAERALVLMREVGDTLGAAWATHILAINRWGSGRPELVKDLTLEALAAFEALGENAGTMRCLWWLILWELEFGEEDAAIELGSRLEEVAASVPGPLGAAHAAEAMGLLARVEGELSRAGLKLRDAVDLHDRAGNTMCLSHCLEHVALWSLDQGDAEQAASLLGAVDAIRDDLLGRAAVPPFERMWHDRAIEAAREALGEAGYDRAYGVGRASGLGDAIAIGRATFAEQDQDASGPPPS